MRRLAYKIKEHITLSNFFMALCKACVMFAIFMSAAVLDDKWLTVLAMFCGSCLGAYIFYRAAVWADNRTKTIKQKEKKHGKR